MNILEIIIYALVFYGVVLAGVVAVLVGIVAYLMCKRDK